MNGRMGHFVAFSMAEFYAEDIITESMVMGESVIIWSMFQTMLETL